MPFDNIQLEIEPLLILFNAAACGITPAAPAARIGLAAQFVNLVIGKFRQDRIALIRLERAALGDLDCVFKRLGQSRQTASPSLWVT